jgi:hypothetical protein
LQKDKLTTERENSIITEKLAGQRKAILKQTNKLEVFHYCFIVSITNCPTIIDIKHERAWIENYHLARMIVAGNVPTVPFIVYCTENGSMRLYYYGQG